MVAKTKTIQKLINIILSISNQISTVVFLFNKILLKKVKKKMIYLLRNQKKISIAKRALLPIFFDYQKLFRANIYYLKSI